MPSTLAASHPRPGEAQTPQHQRASRWCRDGEDADGAAGCELQVLDIRADEHTAEEGAESARSLSYERSAEGVVAHQEVLATLREERRSARIATTEVGFLVVRKDRCADAK